MQLPSKTKEISIKNNTYTVTFPNNRQLINIYTRKAQLTRERYDSLLSSSDGNALYAATLAETIATFETVMPPQFFKDMNAQSLSDLDILAGAELVAVYREQFVPWFDKWIDAIAEVMNPKKEEIQDAA
jgi:hypothetical protein